LGTEHESGHDVFLELIRYRLKPQPHHVLVLSQRIYKWMPPFDEPLLPELAGGDRSGWPGYYKTSNGHYAIAMAINHPSSWRWKASDWHPLVREFLQTLSPQA
jgi:hypothetical protein